MTGDDWRVTDPNINLSVYPAAAPFLPNPTLSLFVDDLSGATRAEAVMNIWGGHIGTTGKKISFNGNSWIDIPEFGSGNGIPGGHDGYNYITEADIAIPVPIGHLHEGNNTFQGTNSGQTGPYGFGWGQFGWYSIILRVYYDGSKPHSTGSISSPSGGGTFGENPTVTASVTEEPTGWTSSPTTMAMTLTVTVCSRNTITTTGRCRGNRARRSRITSALRQEVPGR
jgi:hypothetical protein